VTANVARDLTSIFILTDSLLAANRYDDAIRALQLCDSWHTNANGQHENALDIANAFVTAALSNGLLLVCLCHSIPQPTYSIHSFAQTNKHPNDMLLYQSLINQSINCNRMVFEWQWISCQIIDQHMLQVLIYVILSSSIIH
jgi:hypothetical protein